MIERTRRTVLGAIGSGIVLLAGCTEGSPGTVGFTNTEVVDQELVVEFDEGLDPETISVTDPNGESVGETSVSTGATRVSFDIEIPYEPGEYKIFATDGGDVIAETSQEIRPELEIVDVGVGANRMDEMPENLHFSERQVVVDVENYGSGPDAVTKLHLLEGFPNPTSEVRNEDESGIFDDESGIGEVDRKVVPSGERVSFYSTTLPFADYEAECRSDSYHVTTNVGLTPIISGDFIERTVEIHYSTEQSDGDCDVEIQVV